MESLHLSSARRDDYLVVTIRGQLDIVTRDQLDAFLADARAEHNKIIIDMSDVSFMDTSSLAIIIGHWKRILAADGLLVLAGARYRFAKALWITGLADRLPIYDSVDQALESGAAGQPGIPVQQQRSEPTAPRRAEPVAGEPGGKPAGET